MSVLLPLIKDEYVDTFKNTMSMMVDGILKSVTSDKKIYLKTFAGTYMPSSIQIYPVNFDNKDKVTDYLDDWNKIEGTGAKSLTFTNIMKISLLFKVKLH